MKQLTESQISNMSEEEKIVYVIKYLQASNLDSAVTMTQIIAKGIELHLTSDYKTDNWEGFASGDHPWWTKIAPMMGIGTDSRVDAVEDTHIHRQKVSKETDGRKGKVMVYWYDKSKKHDIVKRNSKSKGTKKIEAPQPLPAFKRPYTEEEQKQKMEAEPGKYRQVNGKLLLESWIQANPEKFKALYGNN